MKLPYDTLHHSYKILIYLIMYVSLWATAADMSDGTEYASMLIFIFAHEILTWTYKLLNSGQPMFVVNNNMTNANSAQTGDGAENQQAREMN